MKKTMTKRKPRKPKIFNLDRRSSFLRVEDAQWVMIDGERMKLPKCIWCNNGYDISVNKAKRLIKFLGQAIAYLEHQPKANR